MRRNLSLSLCALAVAAMATIGSAQAEDPLVGVIIHTAKPYGRVIAAIEGLGGSVTATYENIDGLAADIPADALAELSAIRGVNALEKGMIINLPTPRDGMASTHHMADGLEMLSGAEFDAAIDAAPAGYASYTSENTGAAQTWGDTGMGANSIVAVIDTGTWAENPCMGGTIMAGPDFSTDAGGAFEGSTLSTNHWHGTFVGGVIGNYCAILDSVGGLIETHVSDEAKIDWGGGFFLIPIMGMAPLADIYAVKVFPHTGAGAANWRISAAIDHVITMKKTGAVDVDVINMSLGGATLFDGRTLQEQLVDAATDAGITVVISSGNDGPTPGSVAAPGTAYSAVTVAAGADPVHTRIRWDLFGPGQGFAMYPDDELTVADFSNRGPSADGRNAVDIIATGVFNFSYFPPSAGEGFGWASGTSFSAPTVAGAAALLSAWRNNNGSSAGPRDIKNALTSGAVSIGDDWSEHDQGHGWVNVPNSLALLQSGKTNKGERHDLSDPLKANILLGSADSHTEIITVRRGRTTDFVLEIDENTETVEITVDTGGPIPPGPGALPNSWEIYVKSAKHGGTGSLVDTANIFDAASVTIGDGTIGLGGAIGGGLYAPAPMEPGLMKVTLEPDWTNNIDELTATVTITRTQGANSSNAGGNTMTIGDGDLGVFFVYVPAGTARVTWDLAWSQDWSKTSTNDLDLLIWHWDDYPEGGFFDGATLNAPERQVINDPVPGTYLVLVDGYSVNKGRDPLKLEMTLE